MSGMLTFQASNASPVARGANKLSPRAAGAQHRETMTGNGHGGRIRRSGRGHLDGRRASCRGATAKMHVLTHALHYASSVFEGERAYGGVIFKSREHTERLLKSCDYMDIPHPYERRRDRGGQSGGAGGERADRRLRAAGGLARLGAGHGGGVRAQPGAPGDRGLGVGRLLRRRQDEGREARHREVEAAEPGDHPELRQGGGALHDLHHVQARRRGEGLLGRDHDGLPRLRRRGDRRQRLLRARTARCTRRCPTAS